MNETFCEYSLCIVDLQELMSQYPSQAILASLTKVAQESAANLRALTQKIDLKKDAEELK